jgi:hypothetical protein
MTITLQDAMATTVAFHDQEPFIAGLRERQIIVDSPRIVAEDARHERSPGGPEAGDDRG